MARAVILTATKSVTERLEKFSSWMTAGVAATAAIFIANFDSIVEILDRNSLRWTFAWLGAGFLIGILSKLLETSIGAGLDTSERGDDYFEKNPPTSPSFRAFMHYHMKNLVFPYRNIAWAAYKKFKSGDPHHHLRSVVKLSQLHAVIILLQSACVIAAFVVVFEGIKV